MASYVKEKNGTVTLMFYIQERGKKVRKKVRGFSCKRDATNHYLRYVATQDEREVAWEEEVRLKAEMEAKAAEEAEKDRLRALEIFVPKDYTDMTIRECYEEYTADTPNHKKLTACISEATMLRLHVVPYFGDKSILKLTPADIR